MVNFDRLQSILVSSILPVLIIFGWELAVQTGFWSKSLIAAPSDVITDFFRMILSGQIFVHIGISVLRLLQGFAIGTALGILVGGWMGLSKFGERLLAPTLDVLAPIPPIAWIPLLIITFGIEEASKVALIAIGAFVVVFVNTFQGIRGVDAKLVEVAQLYEKKGLDMLYTVLLPAATPSILTGARVALGLSWILLIAAEVIASSRGLGWLIWDSRNFSRPDDMLVGMITIGMLGKFSDRVMLWIQKRLLVWNPTFRGV